jgi:hypothetical protein
MEDVHSQQFVLKYFGRGIVGPDKKATQVFSRESEVFGHLSHD